MPYRSTLAVAFALLYELPPLTVISILKYVEIIPTLMFSSDRCMQECVAWVLSGVVACG